MCLSTQQGASQDCDALLDLFQTRVELIFRSAIKNYYQKPIKKEIMNVITEVSIFSMRHYRLCKKKIIKKIAINKLMNIS